MSQSKDAVQLCALLVDETYGELASRIFTILLRRGRLPIQALAQHTRLNKRQLRLGLVVLIQQNLIYYVEEGSQGTYYEANQDAAYGLVRSGKILDIVQTRYGVVARDLVLDLFLLGHSNVGELIDHYRLKRNPPANGSTHAAHDAQRTSAAQLDYILCDLLETSLLETVNNSSFRSPDDTYNEVEQTLLKSEFSGATKGTKQKEQLKTMIRDKLGALRFEKESWKPTGNKRKADGAPINGTNGSAKRRRYSNGSHAVNGDHAEEDESLSLDRDLVVRINYEKFAVAIRNMRLVELASTRIGETTSLVYGELLRLLEEYIPRCQPDPRIDAIDDVADGPKITTLELVAGINPSIDVGAGIGKAAGDKVNVDQILQLQSRKRRRSVDEFEAEVQGYASPDEVESDEDVHGLNGNGRSDFIVMDDLSNSEGDEPYGPGAAKNEQNRAKVTLQEKLPKKPVEPQDQQSKWSLIRNHLMLLAADECRFLRRCGSAGRGEWTVDFDRLIHFLRQSELDSIILENFDTTGHRLVRMMRKTGKMDEKQLSTMSLMKQKDVRTKMIEMQMSGVADVQEVPKDTTRANNRTIFLWFFDSERVSSIILGNVYKTMMRCFQRLEIERRRASGILSLTERSDVKGHIEETFSGEQMNMLHKIRDKEDKLLGQVARLDDLVGTFAEY